MGAVCGLPAHVAHEQSALAHDGVTVAAYFFVSNFSISGTVPFFGIFLVCVKDFGFSVDERRHFVFLKDWLW